MRHLIITLRALRLLDRFRFFWRDADQTQLTSQPRVEIIGEDRVLFEVLLGVLASLSDTFVLVRVPRSTFRDETSFRR